MVQYLMMVDLVFLHFHTLQQLAQQQAQTI